MKNFLVILFALLGIAAAKYEHRTPFSPRTTTKIVGGSDTSIEQYKFMASMHIGWWGVIWYQNCGGSLLTSSTILSCAHCYHNEEASDWRAQFGSTHPETGGVIVYASQLTLHAGFNRDSYVNDVAIIRLASPAPLGGNIDTVLIAGPNYILPDNTPTWAVGWGALWASGPVPDTLQHVEVPIVNWQICHDRIEELRRRPGYGSWPSVTESMVCAGILDVGGKDACQKDSGGPLVHNSNVVYGIVSWGIGCANDTYAGVYASVPHFADWIVTNGSA